MNTENQSRNWVFVANFKRIKKTKEKATFGGLFFLDLFMIMNECAKFV